MKQFSWNRLKILRTFFIRLSIKIRTGFSISEKLSDLWPVFDDFVVKNTKFDIKLTQMYQYIQYFENLIRIFLDLFIINKIKIFVFCTARITACSHEQQNFLSSWWWINLIKGCESRFPYCFLRDFIKYVAWFWLPHRESFVDTSNF